MESLATEMSDTSDGETALVEKMGKLKIDVGEILNENVSQELTTARDERGEESVLALPKEYLSPSSQGSVASMQVESEDALLCSIRFQPDTDPLMGIGDSYLNRSPVHASTPAVKPGDAGAPKSGHEDLLSKLYGGERYGDDIQDERRVAYSCQDLDASLTFDPPAPLPQLPRGDCDPETPLRKTEKQLDVSASSGHSEEDYMPIEERIKLLGIDLEQPQVDENKPTVGTMQTEPSGGAMPFISYRADGVEETQGQGKGDLQQGDMVRQAHHVDEHLVSPTRYSGDGGDNSAVAITTANSFSKSGQGESFATTYLGSSRSTDILLSTGELSLTSLEVARILSNAVHGDDGDWRKERSAAEGRVAGDARPFFGQQDTSASSRVSVSLQMEGPDLRIGVGQESLAERPGCYTDIQSEDGHLQSNPVNIDNLPHTGAMDFDLRVDRNMDGESREVEGCTLKKGGDGEEAGALNESLKFVSDDEDVAAENPGNTEGQDEGKDGMIARDKPLTVVESGEDRWPLERSISGSSGSDHLDQGNLSETRDSFRNSSELFGQRISNVLESVQGPSEIEEHDDLEAEVPERRVEGLSCERDSMVGQEAGSEQQVEVESQDTTSGASIPSLVADEDEIPLTTGDLQPHTIRNPSNRSTVHTAEINQKATSLSGLQESAATGQREETASPASSTSNTVDTLELDVRQILHKYGKTLTDDDTEDERRSDHSAGSATQSEKDRDLRMRVKKLLGGSYSVDSETNSDLPSDTEFSNRIHSNYSTDVESETERKVADVFEKKLSKETGEALHGGGDLGFPNGDGAAKLMASYSSAHMLGVTREQHSDVHRENYDASARSSQSSCISYDYLQKELDEIQHGLTELQKYDMSKGRQANTAVSSSNSLRIGDSDRDSEIGTPRKYSWDYSADLGAEHSAEGRFMTRRRKYEEGGDKLGFAESQSSAGSITPTPSLNEQDYQESQVQTAHVRQLFNPDTASGQPNDRGVHSSNSRDLFRASLLPSYNVSAAQKVLARFAEEEKQRKKRVIERDLNAASATRLVPPVDQEVSTADRVQEMMKRDSPAKQAYDFLDQADQERHLLEMRQYIHAQVRQAASPLRSAVDHQSLVQEPLSALGVMRNFLSSQVTRTAQANMDHSFQSSVSGASQDHLDRGSGQSTGTSEESRGSATPVEDSDNRYPSSDSDTEGERTVVSRNSAAEDDSILSGNGGSQATDSPCSRTGSLKSVQSEGPNNSKSEKIVHDSKLFSGDSASVPHSLNDLHAAAWHREGLRLPSGSAISSSVDFSKARGDVFTDVSQVSKSESDLTKVSHTLPDQHPARMNLAEAWRSPRSSPQSLPGSSTSRSPPEAPKSQLESSRSPYDSSQSQPDTSRSPYDTTRSPYDTSRSPQNSSRSSSLTPTNLRPYRPPGSNQVYYVESDMEDGSITTMESTHVGSDDARAPEFHPSAYGTRPDPSFPVVGIYHKMKPPRSTSPARGSDAVTVLDPIQENATLDERKTCMDKVEHFNNNSNVNQMSPVASMSQGHVNRNEKLDRGTSFSASDIKRDGHLSVTLESSSRSDPVLFRTPKRVTREASTLTRDSEMSAYLGNANAERKAQGNDPVDNQPKTGIAAESNAPPRGSSRKILDDPVPGPSHLSEPSTSTRFEKDTQLEQDSYFDSGRTFRPLQPDSEPSSPQRINLHQHFLQEQNQPSHYRFSQGSSAYSRPNPNEERSASLEYQQLKESLASTIPEVRSQEAWSPSPIAQRDDIRKSQEEATRRHIDLSSQNLHYYEQRISDKQSIDKQSSDGRYSDRHYNERHYNDTWESELPADINDMWERFKGSSAFTESEAESVDVDLSRLRSVITNPVRHLVEELRNERRERRHLERQLMENLRFINDRKAADRRSTSPGKSRHHASELSQHPDTDSSVTSVTSRSEVSDLLESDVPSEVSITSSTLTVSSVISGRKGTNKSQEDTLQSIPENTTVESTDLTTDSEALPQHSLADTSLLKLKLLIQEQKDQYLKDNKANEKRLMKIAKLENMLDSISYTKTKKDAEYASTDNTAASEDNLPQRHVKDKQSKKAPHGSPSRSKGQSSRSGSHVTGSGHVTSPSRLNGPSGSRQEGHKSQTKDRVAGYIGSSKRSSSPAKRESPSRSRSNSPAKSASKTRKTKKQVEDSAPPMELRQVRYDNEGSHSPSPRRHAYLEFENPRNSQNKSSKDRTDRKSDKRAARNVVNGTSSDKKQSRSKSQSSESWKDAESHTNQRNTTPQEARGRRSVAVNVPTPISLSPPSRRIINEVTMVSESVQTTPSLRNGKQKKKAGGPFTPDQSGLSVVSENEMPRQQQPITPPGPGLSWFVTFEKKGAGREPSGREPLRERQESVLSPRDRRQTNEQHHSLPGQHSGSNGFSKSLPFDLDAYSNTKDAPTLQEAFRQHRSEVIRASRERQRLLYLKAQERHLQEIGEQERALLFGFNQPYHEANRLSHPYSDQLHKPKRRFMTRQEIKQLTRKNYKRLPEVAQKNVLQRRQEERRANRVRAKIFAKKVQNHLLHRRTAWAPY